MEFGRGEHLQAASRRFCRSVCRARDEAARRAGRRSSAWRRACSHASLASCVCVRTPAGAFDSAKCGFRAKPRRPLPARRKGARARLAWRVSRPGLMHAMRRLHCHRRGCCCSSLRARVPLAGLPALLHQPASSRSNPACKLIRTREHASFQADLRAANSTFI